MNILNILDDLANNPKSTIKLEILESNKDNKLLEQVISKATNPLINYYINKIPEYEQCSNRMDLYTALTELEQLSSRQVTGHKAIAHLKNILENTSIDDAEVIKRVVKQDLRCGTNKKTINKIWKDLIPEFPYMRCSLLKDSKVNEWDWINGVESDLKADGVYANLNYGQDYVELVTRAGSTIPMHNFENIRQDSIINLKPMTQTHGELLINRNGEILPREVGNGIINSLIRGGSLDDGDIPVYMVWDQIPLEFAVPKGKYNTTRTDRLAEVTAQLENCKHIQLVPYKMVYSLQEAMDHYVELTSNGYEGTVLKNPNGLWADGTSKNQVKLKVDVDVELEIVGYKEGNGKNAKTFGSITCKSADELLEVNVSGLKDDVRLDIHNNRESLISTIITVRFNNLMKPTKSNPKYSMFLPRFVEFRNDKTEADSLERIIDQFESMLLGAHLSNNA